ncbi:MAG TPA: hypothetical protein VF828_00970 [Patescibacteria group bacterium]
MSRHEEEASGSGFILGLILGAVVGAVIAIVIYKNRRSEVVTLLKQKLEDLFGDYLPKKPVTSKPSARRKPAKTALQKSSPQLVKKPVIIPKDLPVVDPNPTTSVSKSKAKMFVKPKR